MRALATLALLLAVVLPAAAEESSLERETQLP